MLYLAISRTSGIKSLAATRRERVSYVLQGCSPWEARREGIVGMKAAERFCCRLLAASLLGVAAMAVSAANGFAQDRSTPPLTVYPNRTDMPVAKAESLIARARERDHLRVIVGLREEMLDEDALDPRQAEAQRARLRSNQQGLLADLGTWRQQNGSLAGQGAPAVTLFETIPFLAMNADAATLQSLLDDPRVDSVQEDVPVPPTLPQSVPLIKADRTAALGFSGAGQVVAVLDSGVAKNHPMLAGKVVSEACYSTTMPGQSKSLCPGGAASSTAAGSGVNCPRSVSGCDHGTHVASIAVGNSANLKGVARGAKLIAVKVFSRIDSAADCSPFPAPCIQAFSSDITKGLERVYALRSKFNIASANMSMGEGLFPSNCDSSWPATKAIIDKLRAAKIASVIASGNDFSNVDVSAPGCISTAVTVGSTTKTDQVSSFSNHAAQVELLAPGSDILAAVPGGRARMSGTSMATPHVAGAWAILKQAKPTASVSEVLTALSCTGVPVSRSGITKPRIDVLVALNVLRSPATGCQ